MIYVAWLCSASALLTGLLAIGNGHDWHFTIKDIVRGRVNALMYVWLTFSTIFTIFHVAVITFWIYIDGPSLVGQFNTNLWQSFHAGMGLLFMAAHLFIKRKRVVTRDLPPVYLWGAK